MPCCFSGVPARGHESAPREEVRGQREEHALPPEVTRREQLDGVAAPQSAQREKPRLRASFLRGDASLSHPKTERSYPLAGGSELSLFVDSQDPPGVRRRFSSVRTRQKFSKHPQPVRE